MQGGGPASVCGGLRIALPALSDPSTGPGKPTRIAIVAEPVESETRYDMTSPVAWGKIGSYRNLLAMPAGPANRWILRAQTSLKFLLLGVLLADFRKKRTLEQDLGSVLIRGLRESIFLLYLAIALLLLISLLSYDLEDAGWSHGGSRDGLHNAAGQAGA